jgi:hypothetical protein
MASFSSSSKRTDFTELLAYRRTVAEMYARVRQPGLNPAEQVEQFRRERDALFQSQPQSALSTDQKSRFTGLSYYPYDPAWRFVVPVDTTIEPMLLELELQDDGLVRMQRFGRVQFEAAGQSLALSLFWILGYGGGVFLPFGDPTNNDTTYGGGRYLLDTIKHADLGQEGGRLVIDFNYAYNPSCAYNPRWHCPLTPWENRLAVRVEAGEKDYRDQGSNSNHNSVS